MSTVNQLGKYQPYPEYKDSGISWLGHIPIEWELRRAKFIFQRIQRVVRDNDNIVTAFRDGQVTLRLNRRTDGFTNALQEIGYQGVRKGDLLIHAMDGFAGAIGISDSDGKCSPVCSVCIPRTGLHIEPQYYGYLIRQLAVTGYITSLAKGIRERSTEFRYSEFSPLELALPTIHEQRTIASFLDYETARIDQLIAKQQQLIELLEEKRQAVISHAVTKGLNPNAPMKDSGVEWLGQVPEHWGITRLKYECSHIVDCLHSTPTYDDEGEYPAIRTADISLGIMNVATARRVNISTYQERNIRLKPMPDDIIYSREGERFGMAACVPPNANVCLGQRVMLFRADNTARFLMWALNSDFCYKQALQDVIGSTSPHINVETIKNFEMAWPPYNERIEIASFIDETTRKINNLTAFAEKKVKLLQERRTALISAAVTGKIDLRGWQPPKSEVTA